MKTLSPRALLAVGLLFITVQRGWSATHLVFVNESGFSPETLNISAGDTVVWFNDDEIFSHTTTSDLSILNPDYWDGFLFDYLDSFSKTFSRTGRFTYHDQLDIGTGTIIVGGANLPPEVTITTPAANATFNAPANFTVTAQASDANGILAVEFFVDDSSVGFAFAEPYSADVTDLAAGTHTLTAIATDQLGAQATNSIPIQVVGGGMTLMNPRISEGFFLFEGTGLTPGLTTVLESTADLTAWDPVQTNVPSASTVTFTTAAPNGRLFFRLLQRP